MGDGITLLDILVNLYPIILSLFCTPFALTAFLIGVINITSCSIQPLIPIWILLTGLFLFIPTTTAFLYIIPCSGRYLSKADERENQKIIRRILLFAALLLAIWSIPGTIWSLVIHRRYQSSNENLSPMNCRPWLIKFALVSSLIVNIFTVFILILTGVS